MTTSRNNKPKNLNKYSWSILITFICAIFAMLYQTANSFFEDFFQILPLILIAVYYCEQLAPLISQPEYNLNKSELFKRDLFLLSFCFLLACLFSLMCSYNNSDVRGWWPLIIYFTTLYGLLFSVFFSAVALLIKNHKTYTMVFSFLIIVSVSMGSLLPRYTFIPLLGDIDTFYATTGLLLIAHCLLAINYKIIRLFQ